MFVFTGNNNNVYDNLYYSKYKSLRRKHICRYETKKIPQNKNTFNNIKKKQAYLVRVKRFSFLMYFTFIILIFPLNSQYVSNMNLF